jgi:hypothetical protein
MVTALAIAQHPAIGLQNKNKLFACHGVDYTHQATHPRVCPIRVLFLNFTFTFTLYV